MLPSRKKKGKLEFGRETKEASTMHIMLHQKYLAETDHIIMFRFINSKRWVIENKYCALIYALHEFYHLIPTVPCEWVMCYLYSFTPSYQWGKLAALRGCPRSPHRDPVSLLGSVSAFLVTLESGLWNGRRGTLQFFQCLRMFQQCNHRRGKRTTRESVPKPLGVVYLVLGMGIFHQTLPWVFLWGCFWMRFMLESNDFEDRLPYNVVGPSNQLRS